MKHFRTLEEVELISHGEWSDSELIYRNHSFNYWDIEEMFYNDMVEQNKTDGMTPKEIDEHFNDVFNQWLADNEEDCYVMLDDLIYFMDEEDKQQQGGTE